MNKFFLTPELFFALKLILAPLFSLSIKKFVLPESFLRKVLPISIPSLSPAFGNLTLRPSEVIIALPPITIPEVPSFAFGSTTLRPSEVIIASLIAIAAVLSSVLETTRVGLVNVSDLRYYNRTFN